MQIKSTTGQLKIMSFAPKYIAERSVLVGVWYESSHQETASF